uniref:G-protein coupled receptors family 1 profile domain-containing protein n=1 Tax=Strigamia maritima TaxID=126957 RepID=T1IW61_STRMM
MKILYGHIIATLLLQTALNVSLHLISHRTPSAATSLSSMTLPDDSVHDERTTTTTYSHLLNDTPTWILKATDGFNGTLLFPIFDNYSVINEPQNNFVYTDNVLTFYKIAIPIMLFFCVISIVINLIIVAAVRWLRHMTPTQCFSISLALTNAYLSLVIGLGLLINSLLTAAYKIHLGLYYQCGALTLEALRMAGMVSSVLHLLALAINHYIGILRPLHYASTMTRRTTMLCIVIMWTVPLLFYFIYFSSLTASAYQSIYCTNFNFFGEFPFRIVTSVLFFVPLLLMAIVYAHIFVLVRQHQKGILQNQNRNQLNRNVKAIYTTLLILGTYLIGWMPAVVFS